MANKSKMNSIITVGLALVIGVIMIAVGVDVSDTTSYDTLVEVDSESEWLDDATSNSSVVYTDGYLQINESGSSTTGSHTGTNYTQAATDYVYLDVFDLENGSVDVTVTAYDSGGTQTDTKTVTYNTEGEKRVNVTGFSSNAEDFEVSFSLSRDSDTSESPRVDLYQLEEEVDGLGDLFNYIFPIFGLILIAAAARKLS